LFDARDLVSKYGDKEALQLILVTARDADADPHDRLQAIEVLEELDYRDLPRQLLSEIITDSELDDYWVGDLLLRFGDKAQALERFRRAIKSCPSEYRDQIARRLADLQAIDLLKELDANSVESEQPD
jgi:hypothetical protein